VAKGKTEIAYDLIKQKIIIGELKPLSDISEDLLTEEIGISRTPVREALKSLEKEGFIIIYPRKGTFVAPITSELINSIYEAREAIEPFLARKVTHKLPEDWLLEMQMKFNKETDYSEEDRMYFIKLDQELHSMVLSMTNNAFLLNMMNTIFDHNHRIRIFTSRKNENYELSINEHIRIIEAFLSRDEYATERAMAEHIAAARVASLNYLVNLPAFV
jgi:GntR family transcriptional regulator, rspAB operon transcriptional repressor